MKKIMTIDAESNGLWGKPFCIGAQIWEEKITCDVKVTGSPEHGYPGGMSPKRETKIIKNVDSKELYDGNILEKLLVTEVKILSTKKEWIKIEEITLRIPDSYVSDNWVKENVLPTLRDINITNAGYEEMLEDFSHWYLENKENSTALWHMGHIVESFLFREMNRLGYIGDFEAPYTPIEVSEILRQNGFAADSVDNYAKDHNIKVNYAATHNPLYDAEVAFRVWADLK